MAVYKSTYCAPFLTSIDPRVALTGDDATTAPVEYLQCKVDTSNKNVTGYKIRLLDGQNNEIFPGDGNDYISPIEELQTDSLGYEIRGTNSGINGTFLKIPFFQNKKFPPSYKDMKKSGIPGTASYQAIRFDSDIMVDHLIFTGSSGGDAANPSNWFFIDDDHKKLIYAWNSSGTMEVIDSTDSTVYQKFMTDSGETFFYTAGDSVTPEEFKKQVENKITIDGEEILEGEIIGVVDTSESSPTDTSTDAWYKNATCFYKVTKKLIFDRENKTAGITTILEKFSKKVCESLGLNKLNSSDALVSICIRKGTNQYSLVKNLTVSSGKYTFTNKTTAYWSSLRWGTKTKTLKLENTAYKWEITLYQGDGVISTDGDAPVIKYDTSSNNNYDIIVTTGTVCGSTGSRIQIASGAPFDTEGNINSSAILPNKKDGTLVLQGTYAAVSSSSEDLSFNGGHSVYIETYGSSYGHAYPLSGDITDNEIENADYIRFYKHSTDPEQILDSDIVSWGVKTNVGLKIRNSSSPATEYDPDSADATSISVTSRLLCFAGSEIPSALSGIAKGDTILLWGQTANKQNGVWKYYVYAKDNVDYHCLKRASSYNSWSNYIGKVIYVENGDASTYGKNIQSLASSSARATLWDPLSSTSGDGQLLFVEEEPIILFEEKLDGITIPCFGQGGVPNTNQVDGVTCNVGDTIWVEGYSSGGGKFEGLGQQKRTESGWLKLSDIPAAELTGRYFYVSNGTTYGGKVIHMKADGTGMEITHDLSTARILHNSANTTFISPSSAIEKGMRIKFDQTGEFVKISNWNKTLYAAYHLSRDKSFSPYTSVSNDTPYTYEIRSNFKVSDENPFYCQESPYLIIYKNGKVFNSLALIQGDGDNVVEQACYVTARSVKLSAEYVNHQNSSWESYRWILRDTDGNIKQDSGKKYDKTIETTFYGLFNDNEGNADYYASVYIEDEVGNSVSATFKLVVIQGSAVSAQVPFNAEYIPNLQAVKLSYQDNGLFAPSLRDSIYSTDHSFVDGEGIFDNSVHYSESEPEAVITHLKNETTPPIYYNPSTILLDDDEYALKDSKSYAEDKLGKTERYGLNYYRRFNNSDTEMQVEEGHNFVLYPTTDSDGTSHTELYFETEFSLDGNFQGQILSFDVQGTDSETIEEPCVYTDGTTQDKTGYITILLSNGRDTSGDNPDVRSNRNKFSLFIKKDGVRNIDRPGAHLALYRTGNQKYYLQPSTYINSDHIPVDTGNYGKVEFLKSALGEKIFLINKEGALFKVTSGHAVGNCCLFAKGDEKKENLSYWVEKQPVLAPTAIDRCYMLDGYSQKYLDTRESYSEDGVQLWPSGKDEEEYLEKNYYWEEDSNSTGEFSWTDISKQTLSKYCTEMTPVKRHPEIDLAGNRYRFICRITNVEELYTYLGNSPTLTVGGSDGVDKWYAGSDETNALMSITIEQISKTNS